MGENRGVETIGVGGVRGAGEERMGGLAGEIKFILLTDFVSCY